MEINFEISENERKKVIDFLKSETQTDLKNVKEILARYEITILNLKNKIDYMNIDVEGHEEQVLNGFDIKQYKPSVI